MLCLTCLQHHPQEEMSTTFFCKACVESSSPNQESNLTGRQLMKALRTIGAQEIEITTQVKT